MKLYKIPIIIAIIGLAYLMYQSYISVKLTQIAKCEHLGGVYNAISFDEYICLDKKVVLYKGK